MPATERFFTCNLCEAQCGLRVAVDGARVTGVRGDPDDVLSRGHVCPKAHALRELLDDPERLRHPVRRGAGGAWERVSWEDALADIAARLRALRARHGRDAVALYVGNPVVHSHRASLGAQLLTMALGTKNRFDPNSQDSNPRLFACMHVYGDALSMPVPDVDRTAYLLMLGANPAASNGSQMGLGDVRSRMRAIRERGGRVVLVDPRRTESAAWATSHHFIRPGGDAALLMAMLHVLFAQGPVHASARAAASGIGELQALAARFPPERVAPAVGIDAGTIRQLALDLAAAPRACVYARVGVCQNAFGPLASWLVEALNVVTGNLDREGGAMFPTPPADVGPLGRLVVGNHWGRWRSRVRGLPEFLGALPSAAMAEEMETPGEGQVRALVCVAGNPVLTTPNGERLGRALAGLELVVGVDYYVNRTHDHAHYVLPPRHVFESGNFDLILSRFSVRNVAKYSPPILDAGEDTRDDWDILGDLAARVRLPGPLHRAWRRAARDLPERIVDGMLRLGPSGLTLSALRDAPHGVDLGPLAPGRLRANVHTDDGRVHLAPPVLVADVPRLDAWVDERADGGLVLIGRRHLRSNNSWMNTLPSLAKGPDRARLMVHPTDAARLGVTDGARVEVRSRTGRVTATVQVTGDVMPGVVSLPHGFARCSANALTDDLHVEPVVGTSILSGVPVTLEVHHGV